ncbi:MAG: SusC/RagA family TonB-linked outer membrane protein, partial [Sphingobacteriales bacterium]
KGQPLPGVTVSVKGTTKAVVTDDKGYFKITGIPDNASLIFSMIGFERKEVVAIAEMGDIQLKMSISNLDQVQVIGYGTTTRRLNTGNVSTVKAKEIATQPVNNPLMALQGRVPGMFIIQQTGLPGSGMSIEIRGRNSLGMGSDPLYIVDGVPFTSQSAMASDGYGILGGASVTGTPGSGSPFVLINPADIESIDVLKDADATAIYGTRGTEGRMKIDVKMQNGFGRITRKVKLLNTQQYLEMRHEAFKNDGDVPDPNADYDLTLWDTTRNTDWLKEIVGHTAQYSEIHASVSGGNGSTQYRIGTGYTKQTGVTLNRGNNDQRGTLDFNINTTSSDQKFKIAFTGLYAADINNLPANLDIEGAVKLPPNAPAMYNADGTINWEPNTAGVSTWPLITSNPAASLLLKNVLKNFNVVSNIHLSYQLTSDLQLSAHFGYTNKQTKQYTSYPKAAFDPSTWDRFEANSSTVNASNQTWSIEPQVNYTHQIGKGVLLVTIGSSLQQTRDNAVLLDARGFTSDLLLENPSSATKYTVILMTSCIG